MNTSAAQKYLAELDFAGYANDEADTLLEVTETPTRFVTMHKLAHSQTLLVGVFLKPTISRAGDFTGVPEYEGEDLLQALQAMVRASGE